MVVVAAMVIVTKVFTAMIASAVILIAAVAVVGVKSRNKYCECSDECQ